ncbi:MAG: DUF1588 domain-containing protein [Deltaproteobacteria bacterium]|nr:DUF1588 domain-containing protein [Deltaproteobacteria bacterium]
MVSPSTPPADVPASLRSIGRHHLGKRFEQHTSDRVCASCHQYIDPVGFGPFFFLFEGAYDAVGRYRAQEGRKPVSASGDMVDVELMGAGTHAPFFTLGELGEILAESDAPSCVFSRNVWRFTMGFEEESGDLCAIEALTAQGMMCKTCLIELVTSPECLCSGATMTSPSSNISTACVVTVFAGRGPHRRALPKARRPRPRPIPAFGLLRPGKPAPPRASPTHHLLYFPDGVPGPSQDGEASLWHASGSESSFTLGEALKGLEPWRDRCLSFNRPLWAPPTPAPTRRRQERLTATDYGNNESIDQHLSRTVGADAWWRHLSLGVMSKADNAPGDKLISYVGPGSPLLP